jgi:hypothetical protein
MGDPRRLLPHEVEIFVTRELRKAGLELAGLKVRARVRLSEQAPPPKSSARSGPKSLLRPESDPEGAKRSDDDYAVEISAVVRVEGAERRVLIECRNEARPVRADAVEALSAKLPAAKAQHALMFSTSGYEPDAVRVARAHGVPLLAVADGKTAFARSSWGMAGQPPAWVPEYMAEVVDVDVTGRLRHELVVSGQPRSILDRLGTRP